MPTFTQPIPFTEALQLQSIKSILPSNLDSRGHALLAQVISDHAVFSARTNNAWYLSQIKGTITDILDGKVDRATARVQLQEALRQISYQPTTDIAGTIKDLSSSSRLNLILDTNAATAAGFGRDLQQQDPDLLDAYPAQELYRAIDVNEPRDWPTRWRMAAEQAGDPKALTAFGKDGRMIALKSSPIWEALGSTTLFPDALGNAYAPFAWNSGMRTRSIDLAEAIDLGLLTAQDKIEPRRGIEDFNKRLQMSAADLDADLRKTLLDQFGDTVQFDGDTLTLKPDPAIPAPAPAVPSVPSIQAVQPSKVDQWLDSIGLAGKSSFNADDMASLVNELKEETPVNAKPLVKKVTTSKSVPQARRYAAADVRATMQSFVEFIPPETAQKLPPISISIRAERSYYDPEKHILCLRAGMDPSEMRRVLWHELGHWLHLHGSPEYQSAINAHFKARTKGEALVTMSHGEVAAKDKWYHVYAGRIYGWETNYGVELPSMYLETLSRSPSELAALWNQPEYRETMKIVLSELFK